MNIPPKSDFFYILEMLESKLIDFSYIQPWVDNITTETNSFSDWLFTLATKKYQGHLIKAVREFVQSEPFESEPVDISKFHVACLWLRYERRELSWATFLHKAGSYLDQVDRDWDCETPYHYLNVFEDAYFSKESEEDTKQNYLKDHDLIPWIELAKKKFEPFKTTERLTKVST